ncbi:MAG: DNA ligase [Planctomycetota bacterium]|nr:DNA ligase [Planctomycetota bacterium]
MDKKATAARREKVAKITVKARKTSVQTNSAPPRSGDRKVQANPLSEYVRKRDLKKTPEPGATISKTNSQLTFVIQQHAATRLHWDFRIEVDGVLKSWAVTKEPTMDPAIKRLAIRVEDHPLAYGKFEGDIPAGGYGAGHVDIWDNGMYEPKGDVIAGLNAGKVEVNLHGQKLRGLFALVRMRQAGPKENWLLIKMKDEFARAGASLAGNGSVKPAKPAASPGARRSSTKAPKTAARGVSRRN